MLPILNQSATELVNEMYPEYHLVHKEIFVRIGSLPVEDKLRELRHIHLNALIKFKGVVTKRTGVFPQFQEIFFRCECGDLKGPIAATDQYEARSQLGSCMICQKKGPFVVDEVNTIYKNY